MAKTKKAFDCVSFKRKAQASIYEEIKNMTPKEEVAYFKRKTKTGPFAEWFSKVVHSQSALQV